MLRVWASTPGPKQDVSKQDGKKVNSARGGPARATRHPAAFALRTHPQNPAPTHPNSQHLHIRHVHGRKPKPPPTGHAVSRKPAYLPPHKLSLTPEERAAPPPTVLQRGRAEVAALCDVLAADGADPAAAECREALSFFDAEAAADAPDARALFESFVRALLYSEKGVDAFVGALMRRKRALEALDERAKETGGKPPAPPPTTPAAAARRAALTALFHRFDRNADAHLDASEFEAALSAAGTPLDDSQVAAVIAALGGPSGRLSLDEFLEAVDAEGVVSRTPLAAWLRTHGGRDARLWGDVPKEWDSVL